MYLDHEGNKPANIQLVPVVELIVNTECPFVAIIGISKVSDTTEVIIMR